MEIIFTDIHNTDGVLPKPKPASEYIPQWYKDAKAYMSPDGKKRPQWTAPLWQPLSVVCPYGT